MGVSAINLETLVSNAYYCKKTFSYEQYVNQENRLRHYGIVKQTQYAARDEQTPVDKHQFRCVVITEHFGNEKNQRKEKRDLYDCQSRRRTKEIRYTFAYIHPTYER